MSRRIVTSQLQTASPERKIDTYFDRVTKYIPAEIVAAWVTAMGLIAAAGEGESAALLWIVYIVGAILTAVWIWRQTGIQGMPTAILQIAISTVSFLIWVFALGGPFALYPWYKPVYGSLLLIGYTLAAGLVIPHEG